MGGEVGACGDFETTCLPDVPSSPGPNDCMVVLLELKHTPGLTQNGENLLEDNLRFLEDGRILDKNVVACLRVSYHELYVLFPAISTLIIRHHSQSLRQPDIPKGSHRCVLRIRMSSVVLRGKKWHKD